MNYVIAHANKNFREIFFDIQGKLATILVKFSHILKFIHKLKEKIGALLKKLNY